MGLCLAGAKADSAVSGARRIAHDLLDADDD
jgi:hypothetical protein